MKNNFLPIFSLAPKGAFPGFDGDNGSGAGAGGDSGTGITLQQVNEIVNKTVNNAISGLKKSDLPKIIDGAVAAAITPVTEQLTSLNGLMAKLSDSGGTGSGEGGHGGGQGSGQGGGSGQSGQAGISPELNAQLKQLNDRIAKQDSSIANLQKERDEANKRAETAEKNGVIKTALSDLSFANAAAAQTAFGLIAPLVKKTDDGTFVGGINGDDLPLADFVKDYLPKEHGYLLKPTGATGAGASGGGSQGVGSGRSVDIGVIKPGMKPEERAAAVAAISAAYSNN